jgi:hypothetical protein
VNLSRPSRIFPSILACFLVVGLVACTSPESGVPGPSVAETISDDQDTVAATETDGTAPAESGSDKDLSSQSAQPSKASVVGRTYHQADGNRLVAGTGNLSQLAPLDISLSGEPAWLTAVPYDDGVLWAAVMADGATQAFTVVDGQVTELSIEPQSLPAGMPPLLSVDGGEPHFLVPDNDFSTSSHPVPFNEEGDIAYLGGAGDLVIERGDRVDMLAVNALPDARILVDEAGRLLLLSDPTTDYGHGVLGDEIEAASVTLVETSPGPRIANKIDIGEPYVIEGIAPLWADLDGDGQREIIVTRTDDTSGAQIVAYAEDGRLVASGPTIGRGYRWRHQLAVAPFGPDGEIELVDVLTPHIGGTVEFYTLQGDTLAIESGLSGYTSHVIGTRNLDMAVAGDFNETGQLAILLPNQARTELAAIQHGLQGAEVAWTVPADGTIVTNLAAVELAEGDLAVGVGRQDGVLRIWQP